MTKLAYYSYLNRVGRWQKSTNNFFVAGITAKHNDAWILTQSGFILNIVCWYKIIDSVVTVAHLVYIDSKWTWNILGCSKHCEMLPGLMFDISGSAVFYVIAVFNDICKKLICRRIWNMQYGTIAIVSEIFLNKHVIWLKTASLGNKWQVQPQIKKLKPKISLRCKTALSNSNWTKASKYLKEYKFSAVIIYEVKQHCSSKSRHNTARSTHDAAWAVSPLHPALICTILDSVYWCTDFKFWWHMSASGSSP